MVPKMFDFQNFLYLKFVPLSGSEIYICFLSLCLSCVLVIVIQNDLERISHEQYDFIAFETQVHGFSHWIPAVDNPDTIISDLLTGFALELETLR